MMFIEFKKLNQKKRILPIIVFGLVSLGLFTSCGDSGEQDPSLLQGSSLPLCTNEHLFGLAPVPLSSVSYVAPIGIMAPVGGSPLPKGHTGFMLNTADVTVMAPGDLYVSSIRSTTYLSSPTRPGYTDYAVFFDVCREVSGHYGHMSWLSGTLSAAALGGVCEEYTTVDETIRSCEVSDLDLLVGTGTVMGTTGTPPHSPAMDVGMRDTRVNDYLYPPRYGSPTGGTLCPWDWFTDSVKASLYALLGNGSVSITESPQCGTMAVDQAGTAKGRWTLESAPADGTDPTASDFFVLAPNPYKPQSQAVISTRASDLNTSSLPAYTLQVTGRLNIDPASITADGLIYCYDTDLSTSTFSYLAQLVSADLLKVEKKTHVAGSSVCNGTPGSWAFSGTAVNLIR